jgi:hypothetical protein
VPETLVATLGRSVSLPLALASITDPLVGFRRPTAGPSATGTQARA